MKGQVAFADGRGYIEDAARRGETWDFVVHDVFTGGTVPERLFTREMWRATKEVLKENGVLAVVGLLYSLFSPLFFFLFDDTDFPPLSTRIGFYPRVSLFGFPSFSPLVLFLFCFDM